MADATSTASGFRNMRPTYGEGGGRSSGPRSSFDSNVPAGVDPEGLWRFGNTDKFRRTGTTSAERAGAVPGYTPGYGRASNRNATGGAGSLTPQAQWDAQFTPQLGPQMQQQRTGTAGNQQVGDAAGNLLLGAALPASPSTPPASPVLPPAETQQPSAPAALPVLPPSPGLAGQPQIQQTAPLNGESSRRITGLPAGQSASSTFIPGQNSPQNLAKRTRPPVDPLAV